MVGHIYGGQTHNFQTSFYCTCLSAPEIANARRAFASLADKAWVNSDDISAAPVRLYQLSIEGQIIKPFFELLPISLFTIFIVPFELQKIDPAFNGQKQSQDLTQKYLLPLVDI